LKRDFIDALLTGVESIRDSPGFISLISKEAAEFGHCSPQDLLQHTSSHVTQRVSKQRLKIRARGRKKQV
jgi:hypothetical protein